VLWGHRAVEFDVELVFDNGQNMAVVGVFVGLLMKSYNSELLLHLLINYFMLALQMSTHDPVFIVDVETMSGGSACRRYLNKDIPEIDSCFDRSVDGSPCCTPSFCILCICSLLALAYHGA
jgi:hypothetical protein